MRVIVTIVYDASGKSETKEMNFVSSVEDVKIEISSSNKNDECGYSGTELEENNRKFIKYLCESYPDTVSSGGSNCKFFSMESKNTDIVVFQDSVRGPASIFRLNTDLNWIDIEYTSDKTSYSNEHLENLIKLIDERNKINAKKEKRSLKTFHFGTVDLDDPKIYEYLPQTVKELDDLMFLLIGYAHVYMKHFHPGWDVDQKSRVELLIRNFADGRQGKGNDLNWMKEQVFVFDNETENTC